METEMPAPTEKPDQGESATAPSPPLASTVLFIGQPKADCFAQGGPYHQSPRPHTAVLPQHTRAHCLWALGRWPGGTVKNQALESEERGSNLRLASVCSGAS